MRILSVLVLLLALGACADDSKTGSASSAPSAPSRAAPSRGATPSPGPTGTSHSKACTEVRAGIDAFNASDFEGTIGHFELALPLAEADARARPSAAADDLVDAIRYYAELAPTDYPESARSSLEFQKYKSITLGQCVSPDKPLQDATKPPGTTT